jgi:hypothetical protein
MVKSKKLLRIIVGENHLTVVTKPRLRPEY